MPQLIELEDGEYYGVLVSNVTHYSGLLKIKVSSDLVQNELTEWLKDNLDPTAWFIDRSHIWFKNANDRAMFLLRWS